MKFAEIIYLSSDGRSLGSHTHFHPVGAQPQPTVQLVIRIVPPEDEDDCLNALASGRRWHAPRASGARRYARRVSRRSES